MYVCKYTKSGLRRIRKKSQGYKRQVSVSSWNANLILATVMETTKDNNSRGGPSGTSPRMDLFKGVYLVKDIIAKRHRVRQKERKKERERKKEQKSKKKKESLQEIERERWGEGGKRSRIEGKNIKHRVVPVSRGL